MCFTYTPKHERHLMLQNSFSIFNKFFDLDLQIVFANFDHLFAIYTNFVAAANKQPLPFVKSLRKAPAIRFHLTNFATNLQMSCWIRFNWPRINRSPIICKQSIFRFFSGDIRPLPIICVLLRLVSFIL